ncbi:MAG: hypothetical protein GWO24_03785, partial [Akkermansiaceae bacterium]|nr:hypothetical protein [Akkermansiaceae bacterium]
MGEIAVQRWCGTQGALLPLAKLGAEAGEATLLARGVREDGNGPWFLATWPGVGTSSLARDGVVLFAVLHRALNTGGAALGNALQRTAGAGSLGEDPRSW